MIRICDKTRAKLKKTLKVTEREILQAECECDTDDISMHLVRGVAFPVYCYHFAFERKKTIVVIPINECNKVDS